MAREEKLAGSQALLLLGIHSFSVTSRPSLEVLEPVVHSLTSR